MIPEEDTAIPGSFCQWASLQNLAGGHCRLGMTAAWLQVRPRSGEDRSRMQWFMSVAHTRCPPYCVVIWYSHGDPGAAAMFGSQSLCGPHSRSVENRGCPAVTAAAGIAAQHSPASARTAPSATALILMHPPGMASGAGIVS